MSGGHVARKRFGQNFLVDEGVIRDIVAAIAPRHDDRMVEIGPGLGALTRPLLERLDCLHVVEIDRDLVARLRRAHDPQRLVIHEGDALRFDFSTLGPALRIVGNLPYNISSPLLFRFAEAAQALRDVHVMLQREVVERMVAAPGGGEYGRLSVMLQYRFVMEWVLHVPPDAFRPQPRVESAVVRMVPRPAAECTARDEALLSRVVAAAFSQRRKMLRNTLRGVLAEPDFAALGISPTARAEELAVADYVRIADHLAGRP
ncbi:MAG: 16S rRNA (adenine(1518)-N(6)/adenine(1519)-N(6))-dimethyltransferase RsmA [Betaproteobacteria bacterium]|nr:16S rRNA (adenine(1518)-N(6)/adenine(1519)-N(6))-dimethyltransferase RsmA [Betaproteobacteria bacterium]